MFVLPVQLEDGGGQVGRHLAPATRRAGAMERVARSRWRSFSAPPSAMFIPCSRRTASNSFQRGQRISLLRSIKLLGTSSGTADALLGAVLHPVFFPHPLIVREPAA
jgi:hypothetical protein